MRHRRLNPKDFKNVRTLTLREYNLIQISHINRHKWFLSEELGKDIGFNRAAKDWLDSGLAAEFRKHFKIRS